MRLGVFFWGFSVLATACSSDDFAGSAAKGGSGGAPSAGTAGQGAGRGGGSSGSAGEAGSPPSEGCGNGSTRECVGPGACRGGQVCSVEEWSECDCGSLPGVGGAQGGSGSGGGSHMVGGTAGQGVGDAGDPGSGVGGSGTPAACQRATGAITIGVGALLSSGWTFTLGDGLNPKVVFTFDWDGDSVTEPGENIIHFSGEPTPGEWVVQIADAINAASKLGITAAAATAGAGTLGDGGQGGAGDPSQSAPSAAVVQLMNDRDGASGNVQITETVGNPNFKVSGMRGGADCAP